MSYIQLDAITSEHLHGNWEVYNRRINSNASVDVFADIRIIEMQLNNYRTKNGPERFGNWEVKRNDDIIYNPQLKFFNEGKEVGHAIITRLQCEENAGGNSYKLTLYFNTGLELVLKRQAAA